MRGRGIDVGHTTRGCEEVRTAHDPLVRGSANGGATRWCEEATPKPDSPLVRESRATHTAQKEHGDETAEEAIGYGIDGGHGPIQEYAQHVRVGCALSTAGPQASGITVDRAGSFLGSNGGPLFKLHVLPRLAAHSRIP